MLFCHASRLSVTFCVRLGSYLRGRFGIANDNLVAAGADVTPKRGGMGWPRAGWTALHYCAGYGFTELAELLIERGADINGLDDEGKTPLRVAVESAQPEVADLLLNRGAEG